MFRPLFPLVLPCCLRSFLKRFRVLLRFVPGLEPMETLPDLAGGGAGGGAGSGAFTLGSSKIPMLCFLVVYVLYVLDDFSPSELLVNNPQIVSLFNPGIERFFE